MLKHKHSQHAPEHEIEKVSHSDLCTSFISTPTTTEKNKSSDFHWKQIMSFRSSDFSGKIVTLFHNNMQAQIISIVDKVLLKKNR